MIRSNAIIGVGCGSGHDSGAAIIVDGKLIACIEEERITRLKNDSSFPQNSIGYCMEAASLKPEDVGLVVIGWHPHEELGRHLRFMGQGEFFRPSVVKAKAKFLARLRWAAKDDQRRLKEIFTNALIAPLKHHTAHAASAHFCSGYDNSTIITLDGRGEWSTGMIAAGSGSKIKIIEEAYFPKSLGLTYLAFTQYLGFNLHDEYKVMGLAAYGKPAYLKEMREVFCFSPGTMFEIDLSYVQHPGYSSDCDWGSGYFTSKVEEIFGPARLESEEINQRHMDIAHSLQTRLNEVGRDLVEYAIRRTNSRNLCISGGVFLNGVMNNHIRENTEAENIFVQPASGDGGISLGAALYGHHVLGGQKERVPFGHAYWGPKFTAQDVKRDIDLYRLPHKKLSNKAKTVANLLVDGAIIGWFQGAAELGPRALGNRSIIADPRPAANKDVVNARIKFREEFRPFAPSVLEEDANEWFYLDGPAPYMLMIPKVREKYREIIKAVTHVDGSARPQTVSSETNPGYHKLISEFKALTGCPMILNTSFNVKGEPIVTTPSDAIRCFYSTGLDYLILEDYIIWKAIEPVD